MHSQTPRDASTSYSDCAVVYVASKQAYVDEALESLRSVRDWLPGAATYLKIASTLSVPADAFDHVQRTETYVGSYIDKCDFLEGVDRPKVLFLDGDTFVCGELRSAFDVLERFELAACHAPYRFGGDLRPELDEGPHAYPEFNTGVIFARNTERVRAGMRSWPSHVAASDPHDQAAFRRLLWHSDLRAYVLPPEYNARAVCPIFVSGRVRILHARFKNMAAAAAYINSASTPRTFLPAELEALA